jgi:2-polyprenyl-6-methoxyphenol hydroxylase-like FAD-dependent oxidoreductase
MVPEAQEADVVIVGAGPAGLVTAVTLALHGVSSITIEKHAGTSHHPKAMGLTRRTLEMFRMLGIEQELLRRALPPEWGDAIVWRSQLFAENLARFDLSTLPDSAESRYSPCRALRCPQTITEAILRQRAESLRHAHLWFQAKFVGFEADDEGVEVRVDNQQRGELQAIRCRYLVGADGSASSVRWELGIPVEGPNDLGHFVNVLHEADYLPLLGEKASIYNVIGAHGGGAFVPVDGANRWLYHWNLEADESRETYDDAKCIQLIRNALGRDDTAVRILGIAFWVMAAQVARRWRKGRVFLAGDAAARTTPVGGLGMNTGIAGAHNLAWKLAAVVRGWADDGLLATYETERRPVTELIVEHSISRSEAFFRMIEAARRGDWELVRSALAAHAVPHSRLGIDLGLTYASEAIIPDGTPAPAAANPVTDYVPTGRPGGRAPHVWLEREGQRISALDLFGPGLTLLAGSEGHAWLEAGARLAIEDGVPLHYHRIGPEGPVHDPDDAWPLHYGVQADGAVLVRPDGVVAWRCATQPDDACLTLAQAIRQATCRPLLR